VTAQLTKPTHQVVLDGNETGFATTRLDALLGWARKYSLFAYPFVTACCGMEFMALSSPRFDLARFGAEAPRFSPRQADLLWVVGTISQRQAPVLRRIYEQMMEPKYVLAFGTCASCGGFYDNYTTVPGIDKIIPTDVYVPGCPPRPEAVIDGLLLLQDKIASGDRRAAIVKPRTDPVPGLVNIRKNPDSERAEARLNSRIEKGREADARKKEALREAKKAAAPRASSIPPPTKEELEIEEAWEDDGGGNGHDEGTDA
jgi:NADH-quinone oxidoreductase subunit B